ncbi:MULTISPECIES: PLP-dependent aspartate aminotransferase family protein [unclassified Bradyrhizobium]|uniref:trans-sulfuration enzyme family protein n=1 Tax=unclassified Bradyrhizobium TaxID=2631580 RepID=UPI0007C96CD7|nr:MULTISPECIES: PLP-dependent aspartate aminotransferase family protein [unclassified Bradyrhizobium]
MKRSIETACVHAGTIVDMATRGTRTPLYPSNSHLHLEIDEDIYPRHSNLPNQRAVADKLCALEYGQMALMFSSGMAAISTALLSHLHTGDHLVVQAGVYSGAANFVRRHLPRQGIEVSFTQGTTPADFVASVRPNTKAIYIESPTNPLLGIVDIGMVAALAVERGLLTFIDNTVATPINQNPILAGIDVVLHSATKFLGGYGDITAGAAIGSKKMLAPMLEYINDYGGCLNPQACHLLERSLLTLALRMDRINHNASRLAEMLARHPCVSSVRYPGLVDHPGHDTAKRQMTGFGGLLTFEVKDHVDLRTFQKALQLVIPANSMGEVSTTLNSPFEASTSFRNLTAEQQKALGVSRSMIRMSVGIENVDDLFADLDQALMR